MESVIERSVQLCFSNIAIQKIVQRILDNFVENGKKKVESLQLLAVKSIMTRMMKKEIGSEILFKLIFKEHLKIHNFADPYPYLRFSKRIWRRIRQMFTGAHKRKVYKEMRTDPYVMYAVLERNLCDADSIYITITRKTMRIMIRHMHIAEIPHRNGEEFDTYWPDKFVRLAFSKGVNLVNLAINGEGIYDDDYMEGFLNEMIDAINPVIPEEEWIEAVNNGARIRYKRNGNLLTGYWPKLDTFNAQFEVVERANEA